MCRRRGGAARYRCRRRRRRRRCCRRRCRSPGRRTFGRRPASVRRAACRLPSIGGQAARPGRPARRYGGPGRHGTDPTAPTNATRDPHTPQAPPVGRRAQATDRKNSRRNNHRRRKRPIGRHAARCSAKPPVRRGDAALLRQTAATRPPRDSGRPAAPAACADRGSRSSGPSGLFRAGPARRIGERGGLGVPPDRPLASSVVVPAAVFSIGRLRTRGCRARQTDTERDTERGELDRSRRRDLG
ncbi:Uncharacterised protein [Burkholderia pseudomallei]|nr:Uncharacterised protein [Burkholderia pseudomallei]